MLKKLFIFTIISLIISTTLIKNYTKKLDEQIFSLKENINYLDNVKELVQLENDYLSSPEKLLELSNLYFDDELNFTSRKNIKIITNIDQLNLENFSNNNE
tara:strand:- start:2036 stop:2338 length:303 start_codon:yes stop_codon:yes gene_type:complete